MSLWMQIYFASLYLLLSADFTFAAGHSKVYGPGLQASSVALPVHYFFVNVTEDVLNKEDLDIKVTGKSASSLYPCRIWTQVLDRKDNIFIVRYKIYENCETLTISVKGNGRHLDGSPYEVKGPVLMDDCNCPEKDLDTWLQKWECSSNYTQIASDLRPFSEVDMDGALKNAVERFNIPGAYSFCNYVVLNNQIHRKCYGQHVGFNMFMDAILLSMSRKVKLPDMEFLVNLGDWPLIRTHVTPLIPMFSWCGSEETVDIVMPTYDITQSTLEMMARVSLDMLSVQGNSEVRWAKKHDKGFWRGRDSRRERLDLIDIARKNPELIDAKMTNFFFFRDEIEKYGGTSEPVSFFKFFDRNIMPRVNPTNHVTEIRGYYAYHAPSVYKYQINIDGTVAAYRFPYLLAGGSVVLKQDSRYYEHFYHELQPYLHYIPIKADLSDLVEKINWARKNDEEARKIGENGRKFAVENLLPKDIYCYHAVLFKEWVTRVKSKVRVRDGMEKVEEPRDKQCDCGDLVRDEL